MAGMVIHGAQWGDEGKGKIVDLLTEKANLIVRFHGGNNAGHTLVVGGEKTVLHLIPSGILHGSKRCVIGAGVVLDPEVFLMEVDKLAAKGVDMSPARLAVSLRTHVIMPYHKLLDCARESAKAGAKIGTTGRGIGPCYEDKSSRVGIRAGDFLDEALLAAKIRHALAEKNALLAGLYGLAPLDADKVLEELLPLARRVVPYLADVPAMVQEALGSGAGVLFEGAQGTHLDIDHGTYPFVTSSCCLSSNAAAGSGCSPKDLGDIISVVKAYTTRVGSGQFPTELTCARGEHLQSVGAEFGATTGRKRRCGWLDAVLLREAVRLNGTTGLAVTKLDVLGGLDQLEICTAYTYEGAEILYPPQREGALAHVTPVYETLPGWKEDVTSCRSWSDLPQAARNYLTRVEELSGAPVRIISVGPDREQTIYKD
ncbi:adenylosuccinate synthase [Fundidesulfovibrio terrae]|uniref:adenylosuccinate synthase n=1 Tax=Fundidesulfovibrio terrae TaxID=2922866 RepID=UPI001FB00D3B|nr:adenylosuccinate synthase [Fundidesulfovibrio terrae]